MSSGRSHAAARGSTRHLLSARPPPLLGRPCRLGRATLTPAAAQVYDRYCESLLDWHRRTSTADAEPSAAEREMLAQAWPKGCLWEVQHLGGANGLPPPVDGDGMMEVERDGGQEDAMVDA
jgi:hypothetical protein